MDIPFMVVRSFCDPQQYAARRTAMNPECGKPHEPKLVSINVETDLIPKMAKPRSPIRKFLIIAACYIPSYGDAYIGGNAAPVPFGPRTRMAVMHFSYLTENQAIPNVLILRNNFRIRLLDMYCAPRSPQPAFYD